MVAARIDPLVRSFERFMRAERKSERTIDNYFEALEQFGALLEARGRGLAEATTADVQDYIIDIIERRRPAAAVRGLPGPRLRRAPRHRDPVPVPGRRFAPGGAHRDPSPGHRP